MILAQLPNISESSLSAAVIGLVAILFVAEKIMTVFGMIWKRDGDAVTRTEFDALVERQKAAEAAIVRANDERSRDVNKLFEKLDQLQRSVSQTHADVSRAIGNLEGTHNVAAAVTAGLDQINKTILSAKP